MSGTYIKRKSLVDIFEELALYCELQGVSKPVIKIVLPKQIIEEYSKSLMPSQQIKLLGQSDLTKSLIKSVSLTSGTVELYNDEENEVTKK